MKSPELPVITANHSYSCLLSPYKGEAPSHDGERDFVICLLDEVMNYLQEQDKANNDFLVKLAAAMYEPGHMAQDLENIVFAHFNRSQAILSDGLRMFRDLTGPDSVRSDPADPYGELFCRMRIRADEPCKEWIQQSVNEPWYK